MIHERRLAADHESILSIAEQDLRQLDGARIFVTGGTGFIGTWLLESLVWAVHALQLDLRIDVLTRDPEGFRQREPHLGSEPIIQLLRGDVRTPFSVEERPDIIIHAATPASAAINLQTPKLMVDTILDGMRNVLSLAADCDRPRLLFTSSGAVYGQQPPNLSHIPEDFAGGPDPLKPGNAYHEGKRLAELLASIDNSAGFADVVIARVYALLGPRLPLDIHFAAGNFSPAAQSSSTVTGHRFAPTSMSLTSWSGCSASSRGEPPGARTTSAPKKRSTSLPWREPSPKSWIPMSP
jgi:dTDP-glucose 4,6-dehydratase